MQVPFKPPCRKCGQVTTLRYDINANDIFRYFWYCDTCERITPAGYSIPHEEIDRWMSSWTETQKDNFYIVRLLNDYRGDIKCAVCQKRGGELHHWAPQSLAAHFGDNWDKWPVVYLCREHHRQWHEIVTWYMSGFEQRKNEFLQKYYEAVGV